MRMTRRAALFACVAGAGLLACGRAHALSSAAGTGGAQFLKLGQGSARILALGQSCVALVDGVESLTWNPAGLALAQQKEVLYSYLSYVQGVDSPLYAGYAHPVGRTVWGADVAYLQVGGFDVRDANGVPQTGQNVNVYDGFASIAVARSFWYEKLFVGGALRVVHEDLAGFVDNSVVGDVGLLAKPNSVVSLGLALRNFGAGMQNVPATVRGGGALHLGDFLNLGLEVNKAADSGVNVGIGAEFMLPEQYLDVGQITFRGGWRTADSLGQSYDSTLKDLSLDKASGVSFGFGVFTSRAFGYGISLDYAFVPYGALGSVDEMSVKVRF